ncbi:alpha/beta hydrolase [Hymenobacter rubripertinctus]|uniref:Alpha/beta hydrolase n=2 Tax=Hymenobacter rubripertinctus TaxID=2029981 RepID=A0A418QLY1_9BACT|nr:alpha/beta hydrolase [Hymenobacter rubripertinctus]
MRSFPLVLLGFDLTLAAYEGGTATGPALLFLHGNSMSAATFQRQFAAPELQRFRLVAVELPGHGRSPDAPAWYSLPSTVAVLTAAMKALYCTESLVVAHSYAGHLLAEALPTLPHLRGAMLLSSPLFGNPSQLAAAFHFDETSSLLYASELSSAQAEALARYCLRPNAPVDEIKLLCQAITRTDGRVRVALAASIAAGDYTDEPAQVAATPVPLAFVVGAEETLPVLAYFDTLTVPTRWGRAVHTVPQAGHMPFLENPDAFNALLLDFEAYTAGRTAGVAPNSDSAV